MVQKPNYFADVGDQLAKHCITIATPLNYVATPDYVLVGVRVSSHELATAVIFDDVVTLHENCFSSLVSNAILSPVLTTFIL